ncbi:MAG: aminotransferase class I/II-fold pyridoxal phosphate-dependent enzyme [Candidatus Saccharimonadales bacterium]
MKQIADRLDHFDSSKIRLAFELARQIPNPIDLSIGFPEDNTPSAIKQAGIRAIQDNQTRYVDSNGLPKLRVGIADKLWRDNRIKVKPSQVTVTPGVTTGILLAYLALLNPGDEILLPDPFFPPYRDLASMVGAKPVLVDTAPTFQLTAALIEPLITSRTKVLAINSPNNPSGAVYPKAELVKIAKLAAKHKLTIISDEVYEYFSYDQPHFSIGSIYPNTLTLNGFSKSYAMTGWRIGYIAGPTDIVEAINELQQYIVFSSSSIAEYAALAAIKVSPHSVGIKYQKKRDSALHALSGSFPAIYGGRGAFYLFLQLPNGITDVEVVRQVSHSGVIVLPGSAFSAHNDYIRVSFAAETANLAKGLRILCQAIDTLQQVKSGKRKLVL